jgi:hypothetical protein
MHAMAKGSSGDNMNKIVFHLDLPANSKCIALSTIDTFCICAAFDVPDRGIEIYILNPNTGKTVRVEDWE